MDLLNLGKHLFFETSIIQGKGVRIAVICYNFKSATDHKIEYMSREVIHLPEEKFDLKFGHWVRLIGFEQLLRNAAEKHKDEPISICFADSFIIKNCSKRKNLQRVSDTNPKEWKRIFESIRGNHNYLVRTGYKEGKEKVDICPIIMLTKRYAKAGEEAADWMEVETRPLRRAAVEAFERDEQFQNLIPQHLF